MFFALDNFANLASVNTTVLTKKVYVTLTFSVVMWIYNTTIDIVNRILTFKGFYKNEQFKISRAIW